MSVRRAPKDQRVFGVGDRFVGLLGPRASVFTLAWLATHRDRLRTLVLGGHKLSVLVVWDKRGQELVPHDDGEVWALSRIVYGPEWPGATAMEPTDASEGTRPC